MLYAIAVDENIRTLVLSIIGCFRGHWRSS